MNYHYPGCKEWSDDVFLVFDNAIKFNGEQSLLGEIAIYLKQKFLKRVIAAGAKMAEVLQCIPDELRVESGYELPSVNRGPFIVKYFHGLDVDLCYQSGRDFGRQIAQRMSTDAQIEVSTPPKLDLGEDSFSDGHKGAE
jgi:hypothetical protein